MLATVVVAGVAGGLGNEDQHAAGAGASGGAPASRRRPRPAGAAAAPTPAPTAAPVVVTAPTTPPVTTSTLSGTIGEGSYGDDVTMVQQRLTELGFDPGPVDGQFGGLRARGLGLREARAADAAGRGHGPGDERDVVTDAGSRGDRAPPPERGERRPHRDLPPRAGRRLLRRRPARPDQPHGQRHGRGVVRRGHDQPRRDGQRARHRAAEQGECGRSDTPGGVFRFYRRRRGRARERARRHVEPGVLQLRHRRPRRARTCRSSRRRTGASASR